MKNTRPLAGVTLSPEFATALRDWRRERDFRKERIDLAREEEGLTEEEIAISPNLPDPRGWWEYAVDPRGDGAPTDPNSNAPGSLDRTSDLNTDSLVLQNWWSDDSPGMDVRQILQYQQMLKSEMYKGNWKSDIGDWFGYYTDEAWTPDIYVRTSMADYVPNMFNIFMDKDGDRLDPASTENFWKRTGQTLGQGSAGYALMLGGGYVFLKFGPAFVEGGMEMLERVIGGSMEILFNFRSKWAEQSVRVKAVKGKL